MPSLGFCLLVAEPLTTACGHVAFLESRTAAAGGQRSVEACRRPTVHRLIAWLGMFSLLGAYGARTWTRNTDWASEETLFRSALAVCPDSAKVRLNNGILSRRERNWEAALSHFRRAEVIEPGYCEPTYWIGLTLVRAADA